MKLFSKRKLFFVWLILSLFTGGVFFAYKERQIFLAGFRTAGKTHVVEMRKDDFYPRELRIRKGDTIRFTNKTRDSFWPASDPHPTHQFLNGFDPKREVPSGGSWRYTFNKIGIWRYHDHLNVTSRGTIFVTEGNKRQSSNASEKCAYGNEEKCFDERIREAVEEEGIDVAFALFAELFEAGQAPQSCHWTAHLIGEEVYKLFRKGKKFTVTRATSYCGYAFYHGFMESLLRKNPDTKMALSFCEEVGRQLGGDSLDNCYHGIGHGFTEDPPDPKTWGNPRAMLKPGLKVCEQLFGKTVNKWEICATGVYTVVASFMAEGKYGLSLNPEDPFAFCRTQPKRYDQACYGEFAPKLDRITNWDVSKITNFIKGIEDKRLLHLIVRTAVGPMMQRDVAKDDLSNYIYGCRTLGGELPLVCLRGVVWGLVSHGQPEKEYLKPLEFCNSAELSAEEKDACYAEAFAQLKRIYSQDQLREICKNLDEQYSNFCQKTI